MKENFNRNNNPIVLCGTMGRLGFFVSNSVLYILTSVLLYFGCPSGVEMQKEPLLTRDYTQIFLMFNNAPKLEVVIFTAVLLALIVFKFIFVKKRMLDIEQKNVNAMRNSYVFAFLVACIPVLANCIVPVASKMNTFLFFISIFITVFLFSKKGAQ